MKSLPLFSSRRAGFCQCQHLVVGLGTVLSGRCIRKDSLIITPTLRGSVLAIHPWKLIGVAYY